MKINSSKAAQLSTLEYLDAGASRLKDDSELLDDMVSSGDVYEMELEQLPVGWERLLVGTGVVTGSVMQKRQSNGFID